MARSLIANGVDRPTFYQSGVVSLDGISLNALVKLSSPFPALDFRLVQILDPSRL
jgi:hypothetical protein